MEHEFRLIDKTSDASEVYNIYRECMYQPTLEKYIKRITEWNIREDIKIHGCYQDEVLQGVIVVLLQNKNQGEIVGISVDRNTQGKGVGTFLIHNMMKEYDILKLIAETDNDAVDFYRKVGFHIHKFEKDYGRNKILRYECTLLKDNL